MTTSVGVDVAGPAASSAERALPARLTARLPVLERFCFCGSLRTFNLVVAWVSLIAGVVELLRALWLLIPKGVPCSNTSPCYEYEQRLDWMHLDGRPQTYDNDVLSQLTYNLVSMVATWLFIHGIRENKPSLMVHSIRLEFASIVVAVVLFAVKCAWAVAAGGNLMFIVYDIVIIGLMSYFLHCANSLHVRMVRELEEPEASIAVTSTVLPPGDGPAPPQHGFVDLQLPKYTPPYNKAPVF